MTYNFDLKAKENWLKENYDFVNSKSWEGKYDIEKIKFTGFIAQDVEEAAKQVSFDFSGVDVPKSNNEYYSLRYSEFVVPLVKAVQEQQVIIEDQQKQIDELKKLVESLISDK